MAEEKAITWLQVNNVVPLILSALMAAATFWSLNTRVAVIETKLDTLIAKNDKVLENLNNLNMKVITLETIHKNELR